MILRNMQIKKIKDTFYSTLKISGLSALLFLNSCSDNKVNVVEDYLNALKNRDVKKLKEYCSERMRRNMGRGYMGISEFYFANLHFRDNLKVRSYNDYEKNEYGKDLEDIVWIEHEDGSFHGVQLIFQDGEWKIDDIGGHLYDFRQK